MCLLSLVVYCLEDHLFFFRSRGGFGVQKGGHGLSLSNDDSCLAGPIRIAYKSTE